MPASLAERLGYPPSSRLLIVNADDFGMCHTANRATIAGLDAGVYTSSTAMVPCPWFDEAAAYACAKRADVGVHLTLTSELETYKWGPVAGRSSVPSLVDDKGHFHRDVRSVYACATLDDVERECRAQIDRALAAGIDVTHLDSHMGTMQLDGRYHEIYLRLAAEYRVPLRMAPRALLESMRLPTIIELADRLHVVAPDFFLFSGPSSPEDTSRFWNDVFENLPPGVSEILVHAGHDDAELRAGCPAWKQRVADHAFFTSPSTQQRLLDLGIIPTGYRALRDAQRAG